MSSATEISRSSIKFAQETIVPAYLPKEVESASVEEVKTLDKNSRWQEAADKLYTIVRRSEEGSEIRGDALIGLSQEMINLGSYRLAEKCLRTIEREYAEDNSPLGMLLKARATEKRGWIAEAFGKREDMARYFEKAQELVTAIPQDALDQDRQKEVDGVYETVAHFLGRKYEAEAMITKDPVERHKLLVMAMNNFGGCLVINRRSRERGEPKPANEAFQLEHMAICAAIARNFDRADAIIEQTLPLFQEFADENPDSNILGHYYQTKALINGYKLEMHGEEALHVYLEKQPYAVGKARAYTSMATGSLAHGDVRGFVLNGVKAVKQAPQIVAQAL